MLQGVTVVEMGNRISTAYCGKFLVDAGATVVRIEEPNGDPLRAADPAYAAYLHAGKRSVTGRGVESARAGLAARADVVICDDDVPDVVARVAPFRRCNPSLVVTTLSDYGLDGPWASVPATDFTLQAEAGITALHPSGDRPPVATSAALSELTSGIHAAAGVVMALTSSAAGAGPVDVDVSRFESLVNLILCPWLYERIADHFPYRVPQNAVPGLERAKDGWVCVVAVTGQQWTEFKKLACVAELEDPRFDSLNARVSLSDEVIPLIRRFTEQHTVDELVEMGAPVRLPITPVGRPDTIAGLAPYASRDVYVGNEVGFVQPRPPFRVGAEPRWRPQPARALGADNDTDWGTRPPLPRPVSPEADARYPLRGVRVLEFGTFQAGPQSTVNLAYLGADVIKVEAVNRPDMARYSGAPPTVDRHWERGAQFLNSNQGKRAITADLGDRRGLAFIRRLLSTCDVVLDNYSPRVLEQHGLGYDEIRAIRSDVIMVRMPAWGLEGPWRDRPGFTYTADATSGLADMSGYPDGDPLLTGIIIDPISAMVTSFVTLAAIRRRQVTGEGSHIEVALCDVAAQLSARSIIDASFTGMRRTRPGNRHPGMSPQDMYRSADGQWVAVSVPTDAHWSAFVTLAGPGSWASDDRFATLEGRRKHTDELDGRLRAFCATVPSAELVSRLRGAGVPAAAMDAGVDLTEHPQIVARDRAYDLHHPVIGTQRYIGHSMRFSHAPVMSMPRATPLFGQDTRDVLDELGYTAAEIRALADDNQLADAPFAAPFKPDGS